jgi:hypothetical protein
MAPDCGAILCQRGMVVVDHFHARGISGWASGVRLNLLLDHLFAKASGTDGPKKYGGTSEQKEQLVGGQGAVPWGGGAPPRRDPLTGRPRGGAPQGPRGRLHLSRGSTGAKHLGPVRWFRMERGWAPP